MKMGPSVWAETTAFTRKDLERNNTWNRLILRLDPGDCVPFGELGGVAAGPVDP